MIYTSDRAGAAAPAAVRFAVLAWLVAIAAGVAETLVRLALPDSPTGTELGVRSVLYTGLALLVLALRTGRRAVRWAVTGLLGVLGLLSLVGEPVAWLLAGGWVPAYLGAANAATWLIVLLRGLHIAAVLAALVALYLPAANAFYRRGRR